MSKQRDGPRQSSGACGGLIALLLLGVAVGPHGTGAAEGPPAAAPVVMDVDAGHRDIKLEWWVVGCLPSAARGLGGSLEAELTWRMARPIKGDPSCSLSRVQRWWYNPSIVVHQDGFSVVLRRSNWTKAKTGKQLVFNSAFLCEGGLEDLGSPDGQGIHCAQFNPWGDYEYQVWTCRASGALHDPRLLAKDPRLASHCRLSGTAPDPRWTSTHLSPCRLHRSACTRTESITASWTCPAWGT
jgi:hypothetical protein